MPPLNLRGAQRVLARDLLYVRTEDPVLRKLIDTWFYSGLSPRAANASERDLGELLGEPDVDTRFVPGMRDRLPFLCWRVLDADEGVCCIRDRGHDEGIHEP